MFDYHDITFEEWLDSEPANQNEVETNYWDSIQRSWMREWAWDREIALIIGKHCGEWEAEATAGYGASDEIYSRAVSYGMAA